MEKTEMINLTEICGELRNYFCRDSDKHFGDFKISGNNIEPLDFLQAGQYFRIVGSVFNDGVHQWPAVNLKDEEFHGAIWAMSVPQDFVALAQECEEVKTKIDGFVAETPKFASESYPNGYSYSVLSEMPAPLKEKYNELKRRKARWNKL